MRLNYLNYNHSSTEGKYTPRDKIHYKHSHNSSKRDRDRDHKDRDWVSHRSSRSFSPKRRRMTPSSTTRGTRSSTKKDRTRSRSPPSRISARSRSSRSSSRRSGGRIIISRSRSRSISPSITRRIDFKEKINDTSLFAEIVKDKYKREQTLKEILEKKNEINSSLNENSTNLDNNQKIDSSNGHSKVNGNSSIKNVSNVDIPMTETRDSTDGVALNPTITKSNNLTGGPIDNNLSNTKAVISSSGLSGSGVIAPKDGKPQSFIKMKVTKKLPLPPGVNPAECVDNSTPSPPRPPSPLPNKGSKSVTRSSKLSTPMSSASTSSGKKSLLTLPMPRNLPDTGDMSDDDDDQFNTTGSNKSTSSSKLNNLRNSMSTSSASRSAVTRRNRPTILNRRTSRSQPSRDWGERCIDEFEMIALIGEGTYGLVNALKE